MTPPRFTKTGQPVMGTTLTLATCDCEVECPDGCGREEVTVVGKLWGAGGNADLIGLIVEMGADRERVRIPWPCAALRTDQ